MDRPDDRFRTNGQNIWFDLTVGLCYLRNNNQCTKRTDGLWKCIINTLYVL